MSIILWDARIIDGKGDAPYKGFVVMDGSRLEKVEKGSDPGKKKGDEVIDLDGRTLLPGIIDCHVHLCLDGSADPTNFLKSDPDPLVTLKAARNAYLTLLAGVTTVRDLGDKNHVSLSLRDAVAKGITAGARILSSKGGRWC